MTMSKLLILNRVDIHKSAEVFFETHEFKANQRALNAIVELVRACENEGNEIVPFGFRLYTKPTPVGPEARLRFAICKYRFIWLDDHWTPTTDDHTVPENGPIDLPPYV